MDASEKLRLDDFLVYSWDDIDRLTRRLGDKIIASGYEPEVLIGLIRGGIYIAALLSDHLGIRELYSAALQSYDDLKSGEVVIYQDLPDETVIGNMNVLIVDDVLDSGRTFKMAIERVESRNPLPKEIRTAAIDIKPTTSVIPDYYIGQTDKWIIYPWEQRETIETLWEVGIKKKMSENEILELLRNLGYNNREIMRYKPD